MALLASISRWAERHHKEVTAIVRLPKTEQGLDIGHCRTESANQTLYADHF